MKSFPAIKTSIGLKAALGIKAALGAKAALKGTAALAINAPRGINGLGIHAVHGTNTALETNTALGTNTTMERPNSEHCGTIQALPEPAEDLDPTTPEFASALAAELAASNLPLTYPGENGVDARYPDDCSYESLGDLVERIRIGKTDGLEELYTLFSKGIRFYLCRQLGPQELDDKVHDTFVVVVQAIRRGELREPQRLMGFVRTIVRRQVAAHIDKVVHNRREQMDMESTTRIADPSENPEESAMFQQRTDLINRVLDELSKRDREILTRFYLREQGQDQICSEMALTDTQFRLLKSRAKARFGELGKKKLASRALGAFFMRTSTGTSH